MTLFKIEGYMMLWIAAFIVKLVSGRRRTAPAMVVTAFLSIVFGKETAVPLFLGGFTGLAVVWWKSRSPDIPRAILAGASGIAAAFLYRYAIGVRSPMTGSYSSMLLDMRSPGSLGDTLLTYTFAASDVFILLIGAMVAAALAIYRGRPSPAGMFAVGAAASVLIFVLTMISYQQVYYVYPVGLLAPVAHAC